MSETSPLFHFIKLLKATRVDIVTGDLHVSDAVSGHAVGTELTCLAVEQNQVLCVLV